jgi:hypothetical protein
MRLAHVDLRGSSQSTGSATDLTFDTLSADLEAILTTTGTLTTRRSGRLSVRGAGAWRR